MGIAPPPVSWKATRPAACGCPDSFVGPPGPPELQGQLEELARSRERVYYPAEVDEERRKAYYAEIEPTFESLHQKVSQTHNQPRPYSPSRYLYAWVDLRPDGQLQGIYSGQTIQAEEAIREDYWCLRSQILVNFLTSPEMAAASLATMDAYEALNCEQVVPRSWYGGQEPMRGDLHHLFTCESGRKSPQGNLGVGALARATLYFLLRYPQAIDEYDREGLETLLDRHRRFPPSLYEKHRNMAIEEIQGNRNPLIDYPEWADQIDFCKALCRSSRC